MNVLAKEIREFVSHLLDAGEEIVHSEAAEYFIAEHPDLINEHVGSLVMARISQEIKRATTIPAPPVGGQGVLFEGLPAAVTVRDGVTKPIQRCTRADLIAGRNQKVDNIAAAQAALDAYDFELNKLLPLMTDDEVTVGQVADRVGAS